MDKKIIIGPSLYRNNYFRDLWNYRELLFILSWRDIKIRYKQTVMGILWAILRPLITMSIFTFVFGRVAGFASSTSTPYALVVLTGILPWQFFSQAVNEGANSIIKNEKLITKVYFPRLLIPISTIATVLLDFFISLSILMLMLLFFSVPLSFKMIFFILFLLLAILLALGLGLILSSLNVKFRDFRYIIPFILQVGLFISPVGFGAAEVPSEWGRYYALNPMVGIIEGFRWALIDYPFPSVWALLSSIWWSLTLIIIGFYHFIRHERRFADYI